MARFPALASRSSRGLQSGREPPARHPIDLPETVPSPPVNDTHPDSGDTDLTPPCPWAPAWYRRRNVNLNLVRCGLHRLNDLPQQVDGQFFLQDERDDQMPRDHIGHCEVIDRAVENLLSNGAARKDDGSDRIGVGAYITKVSSSSPRPNTAEPHPVREPRCHLHQKRVCDRYFKGAAPVHPHSPPGRQPGDPSST